MARQEWLAVVTLGVSGHGNAGLVEVWQDRHGLFRRVIVRMVLSRLGKARCGRCGVLCRAGERMVMSSQGKAG